MTNWKQIYWEWYHTE